MTRSICSVFLLAIILTIWCAGVPAQFVSAVITPNPAIPGTPITVTITPRMDIVLTTDCVIRRVRQGTPLGPPVFTPSCNSNPLTVLACTTATQTWSGMLQNATPALPGDYWVVVQYTDTMGLPPSGQPFEDHFPLTLQASPQDPTLAATSAAQLGQPLDLTVSAPLLALAPYLTVFSFTANQGLQLTPQEYLAVDQDPLFNLSFPLPNPLFFQNTVGTLDSLGVASNIRVLIPNHPFMMCRSLIAQTVLAAPVGIQLTNALSFTVQ